MFTIIYMCVKKKMDKKKCSDLYYTSCTVLVELHEIHVHEYIVRYLFIVAK